MIRLCDFRERSRVVDTTTEYLFRCNITGKLPIQVNEDIYGHLLLDAVKSVQKDYEGNDKICIGFDSFVDETPWISIETKVDLCEGDEYDEKMGRHIARAKCKRIAYIIQRKLCRRMFATLYSIASECVYSGVNAEQLVDLEEQFLNQHRK